MTVFKAFIKVMNKYKWIIILYAVMLVSFGGINISTEDNMTTFTDTKPDVLVINLDEENGKFTQNLVEYIKENMNVKVLSYKGNVFSVEPPMFVELEVTYTEPGFSGNTTTTSGKPATLETGLELQVPMFVNIGDVLRIDTRTCEYMERV